MNEKRSIMGSVFEYIKRAATPFLLNLMFGLTMFAVALIDITALKIALMAVLLACTLLSNFIFSRGWKRNWAATYMPTGRATKGC